jgi:hypothetical protein
VPEFDFKVWATDFAGLRLPLSKGLILMNLWLKTAEIKKFLEKRVFKWGLGEGCQFKNVD